MLPPVLLTQNLEEHSVLQQLRAPHHAGSQVLNIAEHACQAVDAGDQVDVVQECVA